MADNVVSLENSILHIVDTIEPKIEDDEIFDRELLKGIDALVAEKNKGVRILHNSLSFIPDWLTLPSNVHWLCEQPYIEPLTKEWFDHRKNHITGSEVGTVLGVNPYMDRLQLFQLKTNQCPPTKDNEATLHGRKFEPMAGKLYCEKTKQCALNLDL